MSWKPKKPVLRRTFDARPDTVDFRDRMYEPTLIEVPKERPLSVFQQAKVPILNQEQEGACTGFGLATVAHYLLRMRGGAPDATRVSPRMFYEMAKRYDEWKGEDYEGSSARAAIKGWHHHGICAENLWPYKSATIDRRLSDERAFEAATRPLGAYYRVNHKDLVAMHSAISEVGVLYATASVHRGWERVHTDGSIPWDPNALGGHAFAIVGYDARGFWIQNSWGTGWGKRGFALVSYQDWLANGTDVWVARLGAPVQWLPAANGRPARAPVSQRSQSYEYHELRPHIISVGNDGRLARGGAFGNAEGEVDEIFREDFERITYGWKRKRILLYAHGGLVGQKGAVQRVADYRETLLRNEVYPLAFIWRTDFWTTLQNILADATRRRRPEGFWDDAKDFMLDRLDDTLEFLARPLGKPLWDEMKENARLATEHEQGAARLVSERVAAVAEATPGAEIHVAGHSAGSIFMGHVIADLTGSELGQRVKTCSLWAPACTTDLFDATYAPALTKGSLDRLSVFTLKDSTERDDHCANIYHKSLLYLVSRAFEPRRKMPILGMAAFLERHKAFQRLLKSGKADWVLSPNEEPKGSRNRSTAKSHGAFDDDEATLASTLARIRGTKAASGRVAVNRIQNGQRQRRQQMAMMTPDRR